MHSTNRIKTLLISLIFLLCFSCSKPRCEYGLIRPKNEKVSFSLSEWDSLYMDIWNFVAPENKEITELKNDVFYDCTVETSEISNLTYDIGFCYEPLFFNGGLPVDSMDNARTLTVLKSVMFEFDFSDCDVAPHPYFIGKKVDALLSLISVGCSDKTISDEVRYGQMLILQKDGRMACFDAQTAVLFLNQEDHEHYLSHFDKECVNSHDDCRFATLDMKMSSEESLMLGLLPHELKKSLVSVDCLEDQNFFGKAAFTFTRCFSGNMDVDFVPHRKCFDVDLSFAFNCADNISIELPSASSLFQNKFKENSFYIDGNKSVSLYEDEEKNDTNIIKYINSKNECQSLTVEWSPLGYISCNHDYVNISGYKKQKRRYGVFPEQLILFSLHDLTDSYNSLCISMYSCRYYTNVQIVEY